MNLFLLRKALRLFLLLELLFDHKEELMHHKKTEPPLLDQSDFYKKTLTIL